MNKIKALEIINELNNFISNPHSELNFHNNYELIIMVILSAQTTDKRVNEISIELFNKYNAFKSLANANYQDVYNIILPLGLAKAKANNIIETSKIIHEKYNDNIPKEEKELLSLPGVGRKVMNVILIEAFKIPKIPVDTHVYRFSIRLGFVKENASLLESEKALMKYIPKDKWILSHHLFVLYSRYYCKSQNPSCERCPIKTYCKYKRS
jgi:endonuclease-3